ncbi:MAG TPA: hypothetical protein VJ259_08040 [Actinomycetota bacterium]|nr:hypothetical protein [Actinomycetota bacterium]
MTTDGEAAERDRVIAEHARRRGPVEDYARGEVRAYHGIVNRWLLLVYAVLGVWAVYYLFKYWGGLGPGLAR